jgi:S-formylglutathione hydrolase FrmB
VRIRLAALAAGSLAALVAGAVVATARTPRSGTLHLSAIHSSSLHGTLHFAVWLPPGYGARPTWRYPVIYVLHGLPGGSGSYRSLLFLVPALERLRAQAIFVFPQGARRGDTDDEYLDLGPGRNWTTALTRELPAAVATRYRTIGARAARGIIGVSAGGYGAMVIGLHNLGRYSAIESWSGYFHPTTPDGSEPMPLTREQTAWSDVHELVPKLPAELASDPTLLAFYTGASDPYPGFRAENQQFDRELTAAGVPHRFAVYPGGHGPALWLAHASAWLELALHALTPAGRAPPGS